MNIILKLSALFTISLLYGCASTGPYLPPNDSLDRGYDTPNDSLNIYEYNSMPNDSLSERRPYPNDAEVITESVDIPSGATPNDATPNDAIPNDAM